MGRRSLKNVSLFAAIIVICGMPCVLAGEWSGIGLGKYVGYGESYSVNQGEWTIVGCTNSGGECEVTVSNEGITMEGELFKWDAPGLQASGAKTDSGEFRRMNVRGRFGFVLVVDLTFEKPKGVVTSVLRMAVAPAQK